MMRDRARKEKCIPEAAEFQNCCKDAGIMMTFRCKEQTKGLFKCLEEWYQNEAFRKECTELYLQDRTEFRKTGVKQKMRKKESDMF
jgi:COX assembly protein 1